MFVRRFDFVAFLAISLFLANNCLVNAMTMEQMENAAKGLRNNCISKTGVDPAIVAGMPKGQFPEDEKFQCYLKCIMGLLKTMKNGRPMLEPMLKQVVMLMPAEIQERNIKTIKDCHAKLVFSENSCIAAYQFIKCQYEEDPEVFFFP